ncbi:flagellar hook-length control protein FliK [Reinekea thalattae]|uniref:Flagellar hook-length control protein-like C-terminal domain-containing protein n=1 Tax=Reinekea thalattae TaxID=2593301 RepID=A0A5C8Z7W2_9GAMM|nr:flagellar hook-length control protein FliK [Reinekea thalattae]TXR53409.1 hypothetical protein FME95_02235 [Reinekea thalattae]
MFQSMSLFSLSADAQQGDSAASIASEPSQLATSTAVDRSENGFQQLVSNYNEQEGSAMAMKKLAAEVQSNVQKSGESYPHIAQSSGSPTALNEDELLQNMDKESLMSFLMATSGVQKPTMIDPDASQLLVDGDALEIIDIEAASQLIDSELADEGLTEEELAEFDLSLYGEDREDLDDIAEDLDARVAQLEASLFMAAPGDNSAATPLNPVSSPLAEHAITGGLNPEAVKLADFSPSMLADSAGSEHVQLEGLGLQKQIFSIDERPTAVASEQRLSEMQLSEMQLSEMQLSESSLGESSLGETPLAEQMTTEQLEQNLTGNEEVDLLAESPVTVVANSSDHLQPSPISTDGIVLQEPVKLAADAPLDEQGDNAAIAVTSENAEMLNATNTESLDDTLVEQPLESDVVPAATLSAAQTLAADEKRLSNDRSTLQQDDAVLSSSSTKASQTAATQTLSSDDAPSSLNASVVDGKVQIDPAQNSAAGGTASASAESNDSSDATLDIDLAMDADNQPDNAKNVRTSSDFFRAEQTQLKAPSTVEGQQLQQQLNEALNKPVRLVDAAFDMSDRIKTMLNSDVQTATIRLDPPELGSMEVKVHVRNEQTQVQIVSSNPQTREALEQQAVRLREALADQGINLSNLDVSDQQPQGGSSDGRGSNQGGQAADGADFDAEVEVTTQRTIGLVDQYV